MFSSNIASTVVQPAFGHLADRVSLAVAALGGPGHGLPWPGADRLAPAYPLLLCVGGDLRVGVAAFHPVAAQLVNLHAGDRKPGP